MKKKKKKKKKKKNSLVLSNTGQVGHKSHSISQPCLYIIKKFLYSVKIVSDLGVHGLSSILV